MLRALLREWGGGQAGFHGSGNSTSHWVLVSQRETSARHLLISELH